MTPLATSPAGYLLVVAIVLPVTAMVLSFALGGRHAERIALLSAPFGLAIAAAIATEVLKTGQPITYIVGGWSPPLGIALRADGFSAVMLVTSALVLPAAMLFARSYFATPATLREKRAPFAFWTLMQGLAAALAVVFTGGDLFTLYVALELLTFAAVPLVCLDGRAETLEAALRYLLFALLGSILYLLGVGLVYGRFGVLDIALLAERTRTLDGDARALLVAGALMTAGLAAKTALFPLHLWLPPAHANAPAPASAVLSALVVKGSFFLTVRLWFDVMPTLASEAAMAVLGTLGCGAILFGSVMALRQERLKLLIAYSTVAQIGYLFLVFPLASGSGSWTAVGWSGGMMQVLAHALAKSGMFLAAGLVAEAVGHDRIPGLRGIGRSMPVTMLAFGLAGVSLVGLPPSGGFLAKWWLLLASVQSGQWVFCIVVLAGGLLAGGYVFRVVAPAISGEPLALKTPVARGREVVALLLALGAIALGVVPDAVIDLVRVGRGGA